MLNKQNFQTDEGKILDLAYNYQKEVMQDKSPIVIANWSRGLGKTFTTLCKIIEDKPKYVLFVSPLGVDASKEMFKEKIKEINNLSKHFKISINITEEFNDHMEILFQNTRVNIMFISNSTSEIQRKRYNTCYDLIIFDEVFPFIINCYKSKQYLSFITVNNAENQLFKLFQNQNVSFHQCGLKQALKENVLTKEEIQEMIVYNDKFKNELDILSEFTELETKTRREKVNLAYRRNDKNEFLIDILIGLEDELNNLKNQSNTVMTREKLLDMILKIKNELEKHKE